ncbi:EF hand domain containing protein [Acanthamoeba castellanii str. Neff]|uniref:EF hand domain containing protein n=1 Tax=Acanthamoeba castellanii (strain ATCC 30010 / Neff) TaxID=1257118 RepID=L8GP75_ACACF|nr:EF hand domain containing protein [Acanthamoeba castellanii str. Neff]ELR13941.1 EF hand domain containing protein [Acanthamoeba castellanii str. Neff]
MVAPNVHKHHTHDRKDEVRQLFAQYDSNKDGHLTLDEVARVFKDLGMSEEDAPMDFKMCSLDSKGTWNWEEFKFFHDKMISETRKPDKSAGGHTSYKAREGEIRRTPAANEKLMGGKYHSVVRFVPVNWDAMHALFNAFDSDNDGSLDKQEVLDLLRIWGTPLDKHLLDKEWPNWDNDFDGLLDWNQYKRLFQVLLEKHTLHG